MKGIEALKKMNRTLLEMWLGMLFFGVLCEGVAWLFQLSKHLFFSKSLWFGIALAIAATQHMYTTLDRALDFGEAYAQKKIFLGYLFRYGLLVVVIAVVGYTKVMDPLIVFLGYMSLKVTVYLQPLTHKLCNKVFQEEDPVPEPMPEQEDEK